MVRTHHSEWATHSLIRTMTTRHSTLHVATKTVVITCLLTIVLSSRAFSDQSAQGAIPRNGGAYSDVVRTLEAGETKINYRQFRESFLASEQFRARGARAAELDSARKRMHEMMKVSNYPEIIEAAKTIASIDYTDMEAHKILQQTYKILGDAPNQKKHHDIEFGLLNSIVKSGDGKTCQTAWPVIQVTEEYFILEMLGAKLLKQSVDETGGLCDKMEVETDRGKQVFYFDVRKVFSGYNKQGIR